MPPNSGPIAITLKATVAGISVVDTTVRQGIILPGRIIPTRLRRSNEAQMVWLLSAIFLVVLGLMVVGIRAAVRAYEVELQRANGQLDAFLNMLANIRQMLENQKRRV